MNAEPSVLTAAWISECVARGEYIVTRHADEERRNDDISVSSLERVLTDAEILEDYPEDKRGRSCLVLGWLGERPVHVVCGANKYDWLVIITVYIPMPPKWISPTERRRT